MLNIPWFADEDIVAFPDVERALREPDGLLAVGGNLSVETLRLAYESGIFPWFDDEHEIMWWSPSERAVIPTDAVHVGKNMRKLIKQKRYRVVADTDFVAVMNACAGRDKTWITDDMRDAYLALHERGIAHSVAAFNPQGDLVGGLYGVFVRNCFCGESMFSYEANTSKLALIALANFLHDNGCHLIDCQMPTAHLTRMGSVSISRSDFATQLHEMQDNVKLVNIHWRALWPAC
ncbi:MAG: leucyl/phenylalanyl-tRNA--protein transferase [Gammaproteobacteria bacterium]|nr:MAG: leucyl/phenylalanyl-tRNA--protein transferase [Gammaproteobacteria bacterium]